MINVLMEKKNLSKYRLAKMSSIPYATLNDICNHKVQLTKCSAETIYKLAKALDVTMEEILAPVLDMRHSFDWFKSETCHRLKRLSDIDFLIEVLSEDEIRMYYDRKWYAECFYLLAMVDYLSRLNDIALCDRYNDLRKLKLKEPLFPSSILVLAAVSPDRAKVKAEAIRESIPEFIRFNIVESEVHNAV